MAETNIDGRLVVAPSWWITMCNALYRKYCLKQVMVFWVRMLLALAFSVISTMRSNHKVKVRLDFFPIIFSSVSSFSLVWWHQFMPWFQLEVLRLVLWFTVAVGITVFVTSKIWFWVSAFHTCLLSASWLWISSYFLFFIFILKVLSFLCVSDHLHFSSQNRYLTDLP